MDSFIKINNHYFRIPFLMSEFLNSFIDRFSTNEIIYWLYEYLLYSEDEFGNDTFVVSKKYARKKAKEWDIEINEIFYTKII